MAHWHPFANHNSSCGKLWYTVVPNYVVLIQLGWFKFKLYMVLTQLGWIKFKLYMDGSLHGNPGQVGGLNHGH